MELSAHQHEKYIHSCWILGGVNWNTAILRWPFDDSYTSSPTTGSQATHALHKIIFTWGRSRFGTMYSVLEIPTVELIPFERYGSNYSSEDMMLFEKRSWKQAYPFDTFEVFESHHSMDDKTHRPLKAHDMRTFLFRDELRVYWFDYFNDGYNNHTRQGMIFTRIYYNTTAKAMYMIESEAKRLIIDHEVGKTQYKNYSPFQYDYQVHSATSLHSSSHHHQHNHHNHHATTTTTSSSSSKSTARRALTNSTTSSGGEVLSKPDHAAHYDIQPVHLKVNDQYVNYTYLHHKHKHQPPIHSIQLFVHSINPHRIVYGPNVVDNYPFAAPRESKVHYSALNLSTVCLTEFIPNQDRTIFWNYGEARGGTPSVLIETIYGLRYLTIFHSQKRHSDPAILTYFFGAYIFEAVPPFAITHITPEPIIPNAFYNETNGWAFKAIDYILFPMGLVVIDDVIFMSTGRNDKSGWMLKMNKTGLVEDMIPIETKVLVNRIHDVLEQEHHDVMKWKHAHPTAEHGGRSHHNSAHAVDATA